MWPRRCTRIEDGQEELQRATFRGFFLVGPPPPPELRNSFASARGPLFLLDGLPLEGKRFCTETGVLGEPTSVAERKVWDFRGQKRICDSGLASFRAGKAWKEAWSSPTLVIGDGTLISKSPCRVGIQMQGFISNLQWAPLLLSTPAAPSSQHLETPPNSRFPEPVLEMAASSFLACGQLAKCHSSHSVQCRRRSCQGIG